MFTILQVLVSLTAFSPKAAAATIDSLYVSYLNSPRVATANAVFAELFREEFTDSLVRFDESSKPLDVKIKLHTSMAAYYLSKQDFTSAISASRRATTTLKQSNNELAHQNQQMKAKSNQWKWLSIVLGVLLLSALIYLLYIWRKYTDITRKQDEFQRTRASFISYVSHELRAPMVTIMGAGQLLRSDVKSSSYDNKRLGDLIVKHCSRMVSLLSRMNVKPKGDAPKMRSGDFVYFLRSAVEAHANEANSHQIKLEFKTPLKTLFVNFSAENIQHIIDLLINNSFDHTAPHDRIVIELPKPDRDRMRFSVSDNGEGIPVENQPYIFSPGHTSRTVTKKDHVDSAAVINVALVRRLVMDMDGTISFVSEPGRGTMFIIDLPYLPDSASAIEHDKAMPNIDEWLRHDNDDKADAPMAFVVESNEDEAFLVARHLNDNFNLRYARDGREALQNAQGLMPDLIIVDVVLPDMSGSEFIRQLRVDEALYHIPVIAMTNDSSEEERIEYIKAGVDALLIKPISPEEMRLATRHIVEQRASLRERYGKTDISKTTETADVQLSKSDNDFINKMVDVIHAQMSQGSIDMEQISAAMSLSRKQLRTRVMDITGLTPVAYVLQVRLNYAKRLMADSTMSLTQVANKCCFQNLSHFSKAFKQQFGVPPQQYRKSIDSIRQTQSKS